jgi:hypothetical protein
VNAVSVAPGTELRIGIKKGARQTSPASCLQEKVQWRLHLRVITPCNRYPLYLTILQALRQCPQAGKGWRWLPVKATSSALHFFRSRLPIHSTGEGNYPLQPLPTVSYNITGSEAVSSGWEGLAMAACQSYVVSPSFFSLSSAYPLHGRETRAWRRSVPPVSCRGFA